MTVREDGRGVQMIVKSRFIWDRDLRKRSRANKEE